MLRELIQAIGSERFMETKFNERAGQFSPDGRWVAYQYNESGPNEIYVESA